MKSIGCIIVTLAIAMISTGCGKQDAADSPQRDSESSAAIPTIYTVNYPLQYFSERIGGNTTEMHMPAPSDEDPAHWKPDVETVTAYQGADLILLNGAGYAKWIDKVSLPTAKLFDTGKRFKDDLIALTNDVTHTHGPGGKHAHGAVAFTTWLDPTLAIQQAEAIKEALSKLLPEKAADFQRNFATLKADLLALDVALKDAAGQNSDRPVIFSHPVYQYLERRYALNGRSVHWEPDEAPSDQMWKELDALLIDHPAKWMIWEGAPLPNTADKLKAMGLKSIILNPCGNTPDSGDYLSVMNANARALKQVIEK